MAKIELIDIYKKITGKTEFNTPIRKLYSQYERPEQVPQGREFTLGPLNLSVPDGKTVVIVGPSGCGKSTLLRVIAGLLESDAGVLRYDGENMQEIPPSERGIGMVFQNYALYPNLSNDDNVLSFFKFRKKTPVLEKEAEEKYQRTADLMGVSLTQLVGRMPKTLSGGERQRVALARCITRDPKLFLMDEPFSNLDQQLREKYRVNLKKLLNHFAITTVYVTHDQQEARLFADMVAVMDAGKIVQVGKYLDIYDLPLNQFVADFLNLDTETRAINFLPGEVWGTAYAGKTIGVRPEKLQVVPEVGVGQVQGEVSDVSKMPHKQRVILSLKVGTYEAQAFVPTGISYVIGQAVGLTAEQLHVFDRHTEERIETQ